KTNHVVAIVDDDPRLLESMGDLLESAVYVARSFSSAGSLLVNGLSDLDLLITDIGMPCIDGFELRDLVRKSRPELSNISASSNSRVEAKMVDWKPDEKI
ncbi:response regulator, partial [Rhizobium leguminosarum]|uniref:response regulator n=1 Tax=Rhizobium leguminosarum TaxID=384 RepID=UPI003F982298